MVDASGRSGDEMPKGHTGRLSRRECESRDTPMDLLEQFPDEELCERRLIEEKYPGRFVCPVCGNTTCSQVHDHAHKWQCAKCPHLFSVTAGTMIEGTHLELKKWFMAIWPMSSQEAGIGACALQRRIGCSYKTAGRGAREDTLCDGKIGVRSTSLQLTRW